MKTLFELINGTEPMVNTIAFVFFTIFGMLYIKIWRFNLKKQTTKNLEFSIKYWFNDNALDFVLALMTALVVYRFFPDALNFLSELIPGLPELTDKMLYGLLLGVGFQYLSHKLFNKFKFISDDRTPTK